MTPEHRSFCYYGHKFEEYVTKNDTLTEPFNPSKQFAGVFQATIYFYHLLYGAEMDCVVEKSLSITEHIELKVCAGRSLDDLPFKYNRKFAKWWIQCFLVGNKYSFFLFSCIIYFEKFNICVRIKGIKTIVIGLRNNNGIVSSLAPLNITDIEKATCTWPRQSFFNFFLLFAQFLKQHVTNEYSHTHKDVVLFRFLSSSQTITTTKSSDSKYHFRPDWFFNQFI
ncbi:unnamed protein product [Rotaria sp. Silwood2]|nr:unnamed protein product [Rotaria sp. Silwood2]